MRGAAHWAQPLSRAAALWAEVLADNAGLRQAPDVQALAELAKSLTHAFHGRRFDVELCGERIRGELDTIRLDRRDYQYAGLIQLRSVDWDGLRIDRLSVHADAVALTPPPSLALVASGVELQGCVRLEPLVTWLDGRVQDWDLSLVEEGRIQAIPHGSSRRFLVGAVVRDGELTLELEAVRWSRVTLRCPRWLRLTRKVRLPALPGGASVVEAMHRGNRVEFRLSMPALTRSLDPGRLLEMISEPG